MMSDESSEHFVNGMIRKPRFDGSFSPTRPLANDVIGAHTGQPGFHWPLSWPGNLTPPICGMRLSTKHDGPGQGQGQGGEIETTPTSAPSPAPSTAKAALKSRKLSE